MHLKDKVVVITGAARGLGKAFAINILEKGAKVCMVKSHEMDSLLKFIFSNTNGLLICYSMYPQK